MSKVSEWAIRFGTWVVETALKRQGFSHVRVKFSGAYEEVEPLTTVGTVQYVVQLSGNSDDMVVGVFDTEPQVRKFIAENPPVLGSTQAIRDAEDVYDVDFGSEPWGYRVTQIVDGIPCGIALCWSPDQGPIDPALPLFPVHASVN